MSAANLSDAVLYGNGTAAVVQVICFNNDATVAIGERLSNLWGRERDVRPQRMRLGRPLTAPRPRTPDYVAPEQPPPLARLHARRRTA